MTCWIITKKPFHLLAFSPLPSQAYIPVISHQQLAVPLIAAPLELDRDGSGKPAFDPSYLPFTRQSREEYAAQSLASAEELGHLEYEVRRRLFSRVKFYPPPADLGDEEDVALEKTSSLKKPRKGNKKTRAGGYSLVENDGAEEGESDEVIY